MKQLVQIILFIYSLYYVFKMFKQFLYILYIRLVMINLKIMCIGWRNDEDIWNVEEGENDMIKESFLLFVGMRCSIVSEDALFCNLFLNHQQH